MKAKKTIDFMSVHKRESGKPLGCRYLGPTVEKEAYLGSRSWSSKVFSGSQGELPQTVNLNGICLPGWILQLLWTNAPISLSPPFFISVTFLSHILCREQRLYTLASPTQRWRGTMFISRTEWIASKPLSDALVQTLPGRSWNFS